ncbi:unnamed protein product [Adineta steineri]|uniref:Uncharacterized protein n=1 Tax=Adineta steineri TaxID=433720 RepID=A0A814MND3_9BILA|nr:unnamed protein product [Adineta steineri]CAF1081814.1 unnamed protein product [Adineta steineri]
MASIDEQIENNCYKTYANNSILASEVSFRKHVDPLPTSNNSAEQNIVLKSRKLQQPLDYLIWSSLLVISGVFIFGFVVVIILLSLYQRK